MMKLNELFKSTSYDDSLFDSKAIAAIESAVFTKTVRGADVPHIKCQVRDKEIRLTPEEAVRQLYLYVLIHTYNYPTDRIQLEAPIHFGREVKRADIAIMDKDLPTIPYIIVELKKPKLTEGKEQLKSYCNATGAPIGVWTNGEQISYYNRKDPNFFEAISDIPKASQRLSDVVNEQFTYADLKKIDRISTQKRSLRALIKEMEDEVLASAGVDSFEEIFNPLWTLIQISRNWEQSNKVNVTHFIKKYGHIMQRAYLPRTRKTTSYLFQSGQKSAVELSRFSTCCAAH